MRLQPGRERLPDQSGKMSTAGPPRRPAGCRNGGPFEARNPPSAFPMSGRLATKVQHLRARVMSSCTRFDSRAEYRVPCG
jgi:hypothetical protein